jgi:hypothetical protein
MDLVEYWRETATRSEARVNAACRAAGAAGYYLGPYCPLSEAERLASLRDVIADLRRALDLNTDPDPDTTPDAAQPKGRES